MGTSWVSSTESPGESLPGDSVNSSPRAATAQGCRRMALEKPRESSGRTRRSPWKAQGGPKRDGNLDEWGASVFHISIYINMAIYIFVYNIYITYMYIYISIHIYICILDDIHIYICNMYLLEILNFR